MGALNIEPAESNIAAFEPFRAQLSELRQHNQSVVFNYTDPKGNKEARSHIYKLRRTKTAVDQARKDAGKEALDYKRRVDNEGKEIIAEIEAMIAVHQTPLDEIEQREKQRIAHFRGIIEGLRNFDYLAGASSSQIREALESLDWLDIDDSYQEFKTEALEAKEYARTETRKLLEKTEKQEAERAELERLQAAEAERQRKEREAQLIREAEERGRCVTAVKESVEGFSEVPDHVIESLQDRETARTATLTIAESFALVSIDAINTPNH